MSAVEQIDRKCPEAPSRARRTLHEALGHLLRKRPYDDIAVKEILADADVARSTFYAHFRDKEELLVSAFEEIVESGSRHDRVLGFSRPMFEHVARHGFLPHSRDTTRSVHGRLQQLIEGRVRRALEQLQEQPAARTALAAAQVASTFIVVFEWWLATDPRPDAREADEIFRSLVEPALV